MAAPKRTKAQSARDAVVIADMFVQGYTMRQMAEKINEATRKQGLSHTITFQQVFYDVKKILRAWKDERNDMIDHLVEVEMAKLDKIEHECWLAWEASKSGRLRTHVQGGVIVAGAMQGGQVVDRIIESSVGDVRFLDRIQACVERRIELLGLAKPKKIQLSGDSESPLSLKDNELSAEIKRLMEVVQLHDTHEQPE